MAEEQGVKHVETDRGARSRAYRGERWWDGFVGSQWTRKEGMGLVRRSPYEKQET